MSNSITPDELINLFSTAQVQLVFEDLLSKGTKLNTISQDLTDSLIKYGIDSDRFSELFTLHLGEEASNYSFEHNCAAAFVNDLLMKEGFYQKGKDFINNLVEGPYSAEGYKKLCLSPEQIYAASERSGLSVSHTREQMESLLADKDSYVWNAYRNQLRKLPTDFPCIRGDLRRGVLEYCQDGDMDYAFSTLTDDIEESEMGVYKDLFAAYSDMEKSEISDKLIELILKLHPVIYSYSPSLISLHSDPEKAEEIYNKAWDERPDTYVLPELKKYTADVFGVDLIKDVDASDTAEQAESSNSSGSGGWFAGMGVCFALALGNFGLSQAVAGIVFGLAGIALGVIGIIKIVR